MRQRIWHALYSCSLGHGTCNIVIPLRGFWTQQLDLKAVTALKWCKHLPCLTTDRFEYYDNADRSICVAVCLSLVYTLSSRCDSLLKKLKCHSRFADYLADLKVVSVIRSIYISLLFVFRALFCVCVGFVWCFRRQGHLHHVSGLLLVLLS